MIKNFFLVLLTIFLCFFVTETALRLSENKANSSHPQVILNRPNIKASPNTQLLYKGGGKTPFRTNEYGEILSGKEINPQLANAYFIGGSTTQTVFVPEGQRWPDLIEGYNTHNFGVSGQALTGSFLTTQFLLKQGLIKGGDNIFLMHAVNDLRDLLNSTKKKDTRKSSSFLRNLCIWELIQSAIVKYQLLRQQSASAEEIYGQHKKRAMDNNKDEKLTDKQFMQFVEVEWPTLLKKRAENLKMFYELCKENNLKLILLTQPNCFLAECSRMKEFKMYPILQNKNLNNKQTRLLLNEINEQTKFFARKNELKIIDLNNKFLEYKEQNELFYDSVHYTSKGSKLVARIINKELPKIKSATE